MFDYIRVSCCVPNVQVADVAYNVRQIREQMRIAAERGSNLALFPELSLTGYSCQDLFLQQTLLEDCAAALKELAALTGELNLTTVVGAPLSIRGSLYNCAVVLSRGEIMGIVPKTFVPNYNEYYEKRWFSGAEDLDRFQEEDFLLSELGLLLPGARDQRVPLGADLIFEAKGATFGIELCEDLWTPLPPSTFLALNGAELILNLSASNEVIAKRQYRRELVAQQSARCLCAYAYCSAGRTESTQDLVFSGNSLIGENGAILAENEKLLDTDYVLTMDVDLGKVRADRRKNRSFSDSGRHYGAFRPCRRVRMETWENNDTVPVAMESDGGLYPLKKLPFVPSGKKDRQERCRSIFQMQVAGLIKRLEVTGAKPVIGVSGGLDSTLALLVSAEAVRQMGKPLSDVVGITMPCFGTTDRTYRNALELMRTMGITSVEIPISAAVEQHFRDIGQDRSVTDLTFENSQARERTQVLMDYAGRVGGLVVGTGDLSELALGWCTYNADHMSMYGVNASIPKTLIRWMIDALVEYDIFSGSTEVLRDVLDTPISPELLPPDAEGKIAQQTESIVGPYALHDFFLYYVLRYGFAPEKIYELACRAFAADFDRETVKKWLKTFYRRFIYQQFKRSCLPDGVKVGSVCLSPRGDWRMPSDASAKAWLTRAEAL